MATSSESLVAAGGPPEVGDRDALVSTAFGALRAFHWVAPNRRLFVPDPLGASKQYDWSGLGGVASVPIDRAVGDALALEVALSPAAVPLRAAWLFLAGTTAQGRSVCEPLVVAPVRVTPGGILGDAHLAPAGDAVLHPRLDSDQRRRLIDLLTFGGPEIDQTGHVSVGDDAVRRTPGLVHFAHAVAAALGYEGAAVVGTRPISEVTAGRPTVIVGAAVFAVDERPEVAPRPPPVSGGWTAVRGCTGGVKSPFPLTGPQRAAVRRARATDVTVVAGVSGTGTSSAAVAIAADSVRRGERVLIAAPEDASVERLVTALLATPGLVPIAFGSTHQRVAVLSRLADARSTLPVADVAELAVARDRAWAELARSREGIARELRAEAAWAARGRGDGIRPGVSGPGHDLEKLHGLADQLRTAGRRSAAARARRQLRRLTASPRSADDDELLAAVTAADAEAGADLLDAIGGVDLAPAWARLAELERYAAAALGAAMHAEARNHAGNGRSRLLTLRTFGEVQRALRSNRSERRTHLAQVTTSRLTRVLPLWVGSLADVAELLPERHGMFDVVIIDDATDTTLVEAAPAIRRAPRTVVCADPDRPRDADSLFDAAIVANPVVELPDHLGPVGAVAAGVLAATGATAAPVGPITPGGFELHEAGDEATEDVLVDAARRAWKGGAAGVAVLTAEGSVGRVRQLASRVCAPSELARHGLAVGTTEQLRHWRGDVVVVDVTGPTQPVTAAAQARTAIAAARRHVVVIHRGPLAPDSPFGGASPPSAAEPMDTWTELVAVSLARVGARPLDGVRSGRHRVDLAVVTPEGRHVGLTTSVHPDGVDAHIDRHLEMTRAGWVVLDVLPSRWSHHLGSLPAVVRRAGAR